MTAVAQDILVRKNIVIDAPLEHVFAVFVEKQDSWWPRAHHIGAREEFTAVMEPRLGGRWYERGDDGSECNWGRVLAWEPPHRVLLSWEINAEWKADPGVVSQVEVRFTAESKERTRVVLEHRNLHVFGDKVETVRAALDSVGGWSNTLAALAKAAELPREASRSPR